MTNKPKRIGTAAETAVVRFARVNGFGGADRQPLRGNADEGDIGLCPGVIVEVKAHRAAGTGQPGPKLLSSWMEQTERERLNADADYAPLIVKRSGTTNVGLWWAYLPMVDSVRLMAGDIEGIPTSFAPVCFTVASLLTLFRAAGYGDPLGKEAA